MSRTAAGLAAALLALPLAAGACAPIKSTHGFQALDVKPADLKVGEDTKSTVLERIGSPSVQSTFDPNLWFYVSQSIQQVAFYKPRVTQREVVAVSFDEQEKVKAIDRVTLEDGKVIAFNGRKTPTRGREITILEQLLGNVGRMGNVLGNRDEDSPGGRGGPGRRRD
jgi:outer membrane protein assembly factor BamE (lipoprotein component of BamABCDE complex)